MIKGKFIENLPKVYGMYTGWTGVLHSHAGAWLVSGAVWRWTQTEGGRMITPDRWCQPLV